jgi:hypothetical protein
LGGSVIVMPESFTSLEDADEPTKGPAVLATATDHDTGTWAERSTPQTVYETLAARRKKRVTSNVASLEAIMVSCGAAVVFWHMHWSVEFAQTPLLQSTCLSLHFGSASQALPLTAQTFELVPQRTLPAGASRGHGHCMAVV